MQRTRPIMGVLLPGLLAALSACKGSSPQATPDAGAPIASAAATSPVRDAHAIVEDAGAPPITDPDVVDFEDQLVYGEIDAGEGDPGLLAKKTGYAKYRNARFGFGLDVPRALTAMPAPENGDGMQWRLGRQVAMTASGIRDMGYPLPCTKSPSVTARKETKDTCWATGTKDGYIFWEKRVLRGALFFSLRIQYLEELKETLDPIVTHVNASWDP